MTATPDTPQQPSLQPVLITPLPGFMELLPAQQLLLTSMMTKIQEMYALYGFVPLDTPILERAEVLLAKAGGDTEKQIYRFLKGDTDIAMRFDLTVPLARFVANNYGHLTFPFKRYAIGKVYRGERPQAGRFREFYQCDIDIIGDGSLSLQYDAELPSIMYAVFTALDIGKVTIRINNRKILNGLFAGLGIASQATAVMQSVDRLDKIGESGVREQLMVLAIPAETIDRIFAFLRLQGANADIVAGLRAFELDSPVFHEGVEELQQVMQGIADRGVPDAYVQVDLSIARGLDYYTGTVYETRLDAYPEIGSICSGGRYEDLASTYTDKRLPGVGMSIGLTRLFDQLVKKGAVQEGAASPTQALVIPIMDNLAPSLDVAMQLRAAGISTEVSYATGKLEKHLKYALKLGIPYVVFVGEDEVATGKYGFKDLTTRTQVSCTLPEIVSALQK